MNHSKHLLSAIAICALTACGGSNPGTDSGTPGNDGGPGAPDTGADGGGGSSDCATYCTAIASACSGVNAEYTSTADCMAQCTELAWPAGTAGAQAGNSFACRTYHTGAAQTMPAVHCIHAGPTGGGVCGTLTIRTEASSTFTRVDRMGMPAVSTALVSSAHKDAYNDENPTDDITLARAMSDFIPNLTALHTGTGTTAGTRGVDPDLALLSLTPCSMTTTVGGLPQCVGQAVAPSVPVASLVIPDTLRLNPMAANGFPNGRQLADPVIDVTLAVVLLDLSSATGCLHGTPPMPGGACTAATLAGLPLDPHMNDATTTDTWPYLAPAHTAP